MADDCYVSIITTSDDCIVTLRYGDCHQGTFESDFHAHRQADIFLGVGAQTSFVKVDVSADGHLLSVALMHTI